MKKNIRAHFRDIKSKKIVRNEAADALGFPLIDLDEEEMKSDSAHVSDNEFMDFEVGSGSRRCRFVCIIFVLLVEYTVLTIILCFILFYFVGGGGGAH